MSSSPDLRDLARVAEKYSATLRLFARQWDEHTAEDVVQSTLLKFLRHCGKKGVPDNPAGWLFTVARNESRSRLRRKRTRQEHDRVYAENRPQWFESVHESRLDAETVARNLQELPLEYREIIVAKIWGEQSFDQIAALLGKSRSGVHRKYVEGLRKLKEMVQK